MSSAGARGLLLVATLGVVGLLAGGCASPADNKSPSVVIAAGQQGTGTPKPVASSGLSGASPAPVSSALASSVPVRSAAPSPAPVRPAVPSSPLLFPVADGTLQPEAGEPTSMPLNPADGQTRDGEPYRPLVFTASNVWLTPTGAETAFDLAIDAGGTVGSAAQVRVSYDLTGDGSWDRVETYRYFATDPEPGIERYTQDAGLSAARGMLGPLVGGVVQLEVWSALGEGGLTMDLADSSITLPYSPLPAS